MLPSFVRYLSLPSSLRWICRATQGLMEDRQPLRLHLNWFACRTARWMISILKSGKDCLNGPIHSLPCGRSKLAVSDLRQHVEVVVRHRLPDETSDELFVLARAHGLPRFRVLPLTISAVQLPLEATERNPAEHASQNLLHPFSRGCAVERQMLSDLWTRCRRNIRPYEMRRRVLELRLLHASWSIIGTHGTKFFRLGPIGRSGCSCYGRRDRDWQGDLPSSRCSRRAGHYGQSKAREPGGSRRRTEG